MAAEFLRDGHDVTVFDSLTRPGVERNLEWLESRAPTGRLGFVRGDVRDADLVRSLVGARGVDLVFHFAAQFRTEDQGWVAHFMLTAAARRPLTIYGNGKQARDLLFVEDLVRAFRLAARHIDKTAGNVYNVGGGPANSVSIWHELRPRLERFAAGAIAAQIQGWRPGDQPVYVSDTRKAYRDFGWKPRVGLDEGLRRLWGWALELTDGRAQLAISRQPNPLELTMPQADIAFAGPSA